MANAEFNPKQNPAAPGGFDAGSYRAAPQPDDAPALTPLQAKLAGLERALPAALRQQAVALALAAVVILGSAVGFGGGKLRGKYNEARQWYSTGVAADNGYNLNDELTERANTAANILTTAGNTSGVDSASLQTAQAALDEFTAALAAAADGSGSMHTLYTANAALDTAIDQLYANLQSLADDPMQMGAVQTQYGRFNSAGTILGSLHYNEAVAEYQDETDGFPASMLKGLFGIEEVEQFA